MKTLKIFAIPSHQNKERTSGVDFARVIQPMKYLNKFEYKGVKFKVDILDPDDKISAYDMAQRYDIIFLNYIANAWGFAEMGAMARKFGKKIVFDVDDALWNMTPDNPAFDVYKRGSEGERNFTAICNEVDLITTTNSYLKNVILGNTYKTKDQVCVLPNYIDLSLYTHRSPFKDDYSINLLHFGSTTHFIDLEEQEFVKGMDKIMKDYPNVTFTTVGAFIPRFREMWGARYVNGYGDMDIFKWITEKFPKFMDNTDILVTPLAPHTYTRCKSSIKFLEGSSAVKPGVWQRIRQYEEIVTDKNGLLASTVQEWYDSVKKLIDDKNLRREMGQEAYKTVEKNQIQDHIAEYAEMFLKLSFDRIK